MDRFAGLLMTKSLSMKRLGVSCTTQTDYICELVWTLTSSLHATISLRAQIRRRHDSTHLTPTFPVLRQNQGRMHILPTHTQSECIPIYLA